MKISITIFLVIFFSNLCAQNGVVGHYRNYFGGDLYIESDSTFKYTWHFDLVGSWSQGKWTRTKDTLYFVMIPVYDSVMFYLDGGRTVDSLVLSDDEKPERINLNMNALPARRQNMEPYPAKMVFKQNRLYEINKKGKLVKKQIHGFGSKKKWPPWFERVKTFP